VYLPILAIDGVAVVVDGDEIVVGADLLELLQGLHEEVALPQPHVVHRRGVALYIRHRELDFTREILALDFVETPRPAGRIDVNAQVRGFANELVRRDDESLVERRNDTARQ